MLDPEKCIADQIIEYFAPTEVVDQRSPVLMHTFARIGMLVQGLTIKMAETVCVSGKVCRDPIDDNFQS